jgi:hypothetical protein
MAGKDEERKLDGWMDGWMARENSMDGSSMNE